jgi:integrase
MRVQAFVAELLAKGLARSTTNKILSILSQTLRAAVRNQLIPRNPCEGIVGPGEKPREEKILLTPDQLNQLADSIGPGYGAMVLVAGSRGLRFGELAGLRPRRVNLFVGRLEVAEALKEVSLLRRSHFERRIWAPPVEKVGLDSGLTFHGLRHTAVSILIAEGASIVELAAVMGWSHSTAMAMSMRYGHLFAARDEHLTQALERVYRTARRPNDGQQAPDRPGHSGETGP